MTVMLKDAPGGAELIESLISAIRDLSLLYAATPGGKAQASLQEYVARIMPNLTDAVGARTAAKIISTLACTVLAEKRRLEAGGTSRA